MKDYISLYTNSNDPDFIEDSKIIDILFDTNEIINRLNKTKDLVLVLPRLFEECFNACYPFIESDYTNHLKISSNGSSSADEYQELFTQCLLASLATLENFEYCNSSIHVNTLTATTYMPINALLSSCKKSINEAETLYHGAKSVSYYDYQKALSFFEFLINPSDEKNHVKCHNANFSKYILENCTDNNCGLVRLRNFVQSIEHFFTKNSNSDNSINELSAVKYKELSSLTNRFLTAYIAELESFAAEFLDIEDTKSKEHFMGDDIYLFLYKVNYFFQPDLIYTFLRSIKNVSFYESYNFFTKTYDALCSSCHLPLRLALLEYHESLTPLKKRYENPTQFSETTYEDIYKSFLPIIQKLFFMLLLRLGETYQNKDDNLHLLSKAITEHLNNQNMAEITQANFRIIVRKLRALLEENVLAPENTFSDDLIDFARYIVRNFFSFSFSSCLPVLDPKHIRDYELLLTILPMSDYKLTRQSEKERKNKTHLQRTTENLATLPCK